MSGEPDSSDRVSDISDSDAFLSAKIRYFGSIRSAAGIEEEEVKIPSESTLVHLLYVVAKSHSKELRDEILQIDSNDLRTDLMITLNGVILSSEEIDKRVIQVKDVISLFPIFPGGG